jgi:outer membrane protein OmpA-like peptidoglycan-associated protein
MFHVDNLGEGVNEGHKCSGPVLSSDGKTLYYFKADHPTNIGRTRDIWVSKFNSQDSTWGKGKRMLAPINDYGDNSVHSVSPDGKTLVLHNIYLKNGTSKNGVSMSKLQEDGTWEFPKQIKIRKYKNKQVCSFFLADDGEVLILAIEGNPSFGKQDLYVSFKEKDSEWFSAPKNMGKMINTPGMEATAFLSADEHTMYFSSDGKGGLGGTDIFESKRLDSTWTNWSKPINMGAPYNTPDNEFYFSVPAKGDYAYMARRYHLSDTNVKSDIVRIKLAAEKQPDPVLILSGMVYDNYDNKLIHANVKFVRIPDSQESGHSSTDTITGYTVTLPKGYRYVAVSESKGYDTKYDTIDVRNLTHYEERIHDIHMERNPAVIVSGKLYDEESKAPLAGEVHIYKIVDKVEIFYKKLSLGDSYEANLPAGAEYRIVAKSDGYLNGEALVDLRKTRKFDKRQQDLYLLKIKKNLTFTIKNIYFAFDKTDLLSKSFVELDNLTEILKDASTISVEISGHTDNKGSDSYNQTLSQGRAQSVVNYLVKKGIETSRLVAKGYGESKPIKTNDTDEGRAENRRVEFKILEIK